MLPVILPPAGLPQPGCALLSSCLTHWLLNWLLVRLNVHAGKLLCMAALQRPGSSCSTTLPGSVGAC